MDLVFSTVLNSSFELTTDLKTYQSSQLPKLAYTTTNDDFGVYIKSDDLLFENHIRKELPVVKDFYKDTPIFFNSSSDSFLHYDLFATVFYFAVRYEEYLPSELDIHQRFKAENSLAFKHSILNKAFLNGLIQDFSQKLIVRFPSLKFKQRSFNFLSTIDIDNAFAYANKGFKRNVAGFIKDSSKLDFKQISSRFKSFFNSEKDPYNTYDLINSISNETNTPLKYFVLIADYSKFDKNPHHQNKEFIKLLKQLSVCHSIGLHPSYESFNSSEKIEIEKKRLENSIEQKITSARCHFLRIKFPETYRCFINNGITDDYTMIYASQSGFRTGLCIPYKWFDLEKNETTLLTIHPSTVMEGTLRDYNKLSPQLAIQTINNLLEEVKKHGGEFVSIWHNDSFTESQKNWIDVYKNLLQNKNITTVSL